MLVIYSNINSVIEIHYCDMIMLVIPQTVKLNLLIYSDHKLFSLYSPITLFSFGMILLHKIRINLDINIMTIDIAIKLLLYINPCIHNL